MGLDGDRLESQQTLAAVAHRCKTYSAALEHVRARYGKLRLRRGLLVVRAEDPGFRALVLARLGEAVRALGGPYLAE